MDYTNLVQIIEAPSRTDVLGWMKTNQEEVQAALRDKGGVLLRGFGGEGDEIAANALKTLSPELLEDAFWSTPRTGVKGKTFTATEYPGQRTISLHSEMAYMNTFPRFLAFHSIVVADEGGETTLGDLNAISTDLEDLLPHFANGVMYKRSYHPGVDIPWRQAFRVDDRRGVQQVAKKMGMELEWVDDETLKTRHRAQGCITDEEGKLLWFNQSHVFHASNLSDQDRTTLTDLFGLDGLPRHACYANGSEISDETIARIQQTLTANTVGVKWQPGDVLIIDNLRLMHGRWPYSGSRKLHVAMAQAHTIPSRTPLTFKKGFRARVWSRLAG